MNTSTLTPARTACKFGGEPMTRTEQAEIATVRARLVAAAKATGPGTRRAAAQLRNDLATWQSWVADGVSLPRLPRRIRIGLAKPTKPQKVPKNKSPKRTEKPTCDIDTVKQAIFQDEAREIVASNYDVCRAIAMRTIGRYRLAEDCVSASVLSALEQIAQGKVAFASADKAGAWIRQIVRYNAARTLRTLTYTKVGDIMPSKGILPSVGRQGTSPNADEEVDPRHHKEDDDGDEDSRKDFDEYFHRAQDDLRTVGVSKRCPGADDQ
jgi:DNA-directed RNA polymerase specialized sigma24 family protein